MDKLSNTFLYLRHFSFIAFLVAMLYLYPGFHTYNFGILCLVLSMFYIIITFIMFFVKSDTEEMNFLNNFVLFFLHGYVCFLAYRFTSVYNVAFTDADIYFKINFFIISICLFILTMNKIILANSK